MTRMLIIMLTENYWRDRYMALEREVALQGVNLPRREVEQANAPAAPENVERVANTESPSRVSKYFSVLININLD